MLKIWLQFDIIQLLKIDNDFDVFTRLQKVIKIHLLQ